MSIKDTLSKIGGAASGLAEGAMGIHKKKKSSSSETKPSSKKKKFASALAGAFRGKPSHNLE